MEDQEIFEDLSEDQDGDDYHELTVMLDPLTVIDTVENLGIDEAVAVITEASRDQLESMVKQLVDSLIIEGTTLEDKEVN